MADAHIGFRLSGQRALCTHVVPALRCVSMLIEEEPRKCTVRFCFEREPSASERECCQVATAEVHADYPDWDVQDVVEVTVPPAKPALLPWTLYYRCEDDWVSPEA